jgi:putative FmdB family regulatory protein
MPLYEYECKKCHHRFERIQKFSDPYMKKCPDCGGVVEMVVSAPAVQFKGSGWYVTDYAKKSSAPSSSNGESGSKSESDSKNDAKGGSESKSDSETKAKKEDNSKQDSSSSSKKAEKKISSREKS